MKNLHLLLIFVLLPALSFAQLQIKIGNDTTFCGSISLDYEAPQLGTNLTITGGIPPYKYAWSAKINAFGNYYAKDLLNDTTISTPTFKNHWLNQTWESFTLTVTDAENNTATDVVKVRFSLFGITLGYITYYVNAGDEIILSDIPIGSGIEPYRSYSWSPPDDLLTPNERTTVCKPSKSARYYITVEDSVVCKATGHSCDVEVVPVGITETESPHNDIPFISDGALFWKNTEKLPVKINLYSLTGAKIKEIYPTTDEYSLKTNISAPILYEIIIGNKRYVGKYILKQ